MKKKFHWVLFTWYMITSWKKKGTIYYHLTVWFRMKAKPLNKSGKQYATLLSCSSVFCNLNCTACYTQVIYHLLSPNIANSEMNTQALQFRTLNTVNETRE